MNQGAAPETAPVQSADALREVTAKLLDVEQPPCSLGPEVAALRQLVNEASGFLTEPDRAITDGETRLGTGLAISPIQAAMCADEVARTPVFIRALNEAIRTHRATRENRRTRVLYAGCGPFALLAIPQMAMFPDSDLSFAFLECHRESLNSARTLVDRLGFSGHVDRYEECDASEYRIPPAEIPDIIVSETMNVVLSDEPQVMVARHLLRQATDALMVPESVQIRAALVDLSREFAFVRDGDESGELPEPDRDRIDLGMIFELNTRTIRQWAGEMGERLPAAAIRVPDPLEPRYQVQFLTEVRAFGNHRLRDYDCSLTIPTPVPVKTPFRGGETLQFHYQLGNRPRLICESVGPPA